MNVPSYGVNNSNLNLVDARASYWNDPSGPSGNGPGSGAAVSANVWYRPWLETAQNPHYFVTSAEVTRSTINKNENATTLNASLSAPGVWTLQILDNEEEEVNAYSGSGTTVSASWGGEQDGDEGKVPDGSYTLRLTATDLATGEAMAPLVDQVTVEGGESSLPVALFSAPHPGAVVQGGGPISLIGSAKDADDFLSYQVEYGEGTSPSVWRTITSPEEITTPVDLGELAVWDTSGLTGTTYLFRLTTTDAGGLETQAHLIARLFTIIELSTSEVYISPNGDLFQDTTTVTGTVNMPGDWTLGIRDVYGAVVRLFSGKGAHVRVSWDGKDDTGNIVPEGTYSVVLEAVESTSGTEAFPLSGIVHVDLTKPTAEITAPVEGQIVFDTVSITGTANETNLREYRLDYHRAGALPGWRYIHYSTDPVTNDILAEWETNSYTDAVSSAAYHEATTIVLKVTDAAGNVTTDTVTVNLDSLYITNVSASDNLIHPLLGESSEIFFDVTEDVALAKVRIVPEFSPWKQFPDRSPEADAVRTMDLGNLTAGSHSVIWDGKDDGGGFVPDEAYIYVIEAHRDLPPLSGRFDKFNRYEFNDYTALPYPAGIEFPAERTSYDPLANEFISHTFSVTASPGRTGFRIEITDSLGATRQLWPHRHVLLSLGDNTVFWDGRDEAGNIVTDIATINYMVNGFRTDCVDCGEDDQTSFHRLKNNYIQVAGTLPDVPMVSIKSDPYVMVLSYGQLARLKYRLESDAEVSITVEGPSGGERTLLTAAPQLAGEHEVVWDGTDDGGRLFTGEGNATFTVTATNPVSGLSLSRKGNIIVRK